MVSDSWLLWTVVQLLQQFTPNSISSPHYCTGYVTTNEKYVLLLEDSIESTQLQKADNETCILMVCVCIFLVAFLIVRLITPLIFL